MSGNVDTLREAHATFGGWALEENSGGDPTVLSGEVFSLQVAKPTPP